MDECEKIAKSDEKLALKNFCQIIEKYGIQLAFERYKRCATSHITTLL